MHVLVCNRLHDLISGNWCSIESFVMFIANKAARWNETFKRTIIEYSFFHSSIIEIDVLFGWNPVINRHVIGH